MAPAETIEPWAFDNSIAEALERGDVAVNEQNTEVLATVIASDAANSKRTFSLQHHDLRIRKSLGASENAISAETRRRYRIMFRNRAYNAVMFDIPALRDAGAGLTLSRETPETEWQPAAVVRIDHEQGNKPVLWLTEARWEDGRVPDQRPC